VPSRQDHLNLADHNQRVIDFLLTSPEPFPDWVTTVAFYKAVHLVEAVFESDGIGHSGDHKRRAALLKSERRYDMLSHHYRPLKNASEIARYLQAEEGTAYRTFTDFLPPEKVKTEILGHRLNQLEQSARKLLTSPKARSS